MNNWESLNRAMNNAIIYVSITNGSKLDIKQIANHKFTDCWWIIADGWL